MNANEKVAMWIEKNVGGNQTELGRLANIPQPKISDIYNGNTRVTTERAVRLATAMKVSLEWLLRDEYNWPPFGPDESKPTLSPAEQKILFLAHELSSGDADPNALESARRRLMGISLDPAAAAPAHTAPFALKTDGEPMSQVQANAAKPKAAPKSQGRNR